MPLKKDKAKARAVQREFSCGVRAWVSWLVHGCSAEQQFPAKPRAKPENLIGHGGLMPNPFPLHGSLILLDLVGERPAQLLCLVLGVGQLRRQPPNPFSRRENALLFGIPRDIVATRKRELPVEVWYVPGAGKETKGCMMAISGTKKGLHGHNIDLRVSFRSLQRTFKTTNRHSDSSEMVQQTQDRQATTHPLREELLSRQASWPSFRSS